MFLEVKKEGKSKFVPKKRGSGLVKAKGAKKSKGTIAKASKRKSRRRKKQ